MRGARPTLFAMMLVACVAGCDDDSVAPPGTSVWRPHWSHPLPTGATFRGAGAPAGPGSREFEQWMVGDGGVIAHYGGQGLNAVASPTTQSLRDVVVFSNTDLFVVGDGGTIIGPGLALQASPTTNDLYALFGFSASNLIAVGANGTIIANDGGGWQSVTSPTSANLYGVWALVDGEMVAVGAGGVVIRKVGVAPWSIDSTFTARDLNAVWADKPRDWFVVGDGGEIWQDRGAGWTPMASPRSDDFYDVFGSDSAFVFAVGDADSILFYDQISWQPVAPNPCGHLDAIWAFICPLSFASTSNARDPHCSNTYVAGAGGFVGNYTLFRTFDLVSDGLTYEDLHGIHGGEIGDLYAVGDGGVVLRHNGTAWSLSPTGFTENLRDVFVVSPLDVFMVGDGGRVLRGADGAWTPMTSGVATSLRGAWASNASNVFAVGDAGTILRFDGVDWNPESAPGVDYTDVWGISTGEVFAVARGGTIVERVGGFWSSVPSPSVDLFGVWASSVDNAFAVGAGGLILRREGGVWQSMESGTQDDLRAVSGEGGSVWAVGDGGVVLRFDGTSWSSEPSEPVAGLDAVFARLGEQMFAAGSSGSVIRFQRETQ